jgi:N-acetylglutamate synthase-like GNAT family acetyltransferase
MIIRAATSADIPAITGLVQTHYRRGEVLPRSAKEIQDSLADWVVGEKDGRVLACGSLLHYSPTLAEVRSLVVHDDAKRNGLGSAVVKALISLARNNKVPTLFALTRVSPFFSKLNFHPSEKELFPEKIWRDCQLCPIQDHCDESAMVIHLNGRGHVPDQFTISENKGGNQVRK